MKILYIAYSCNPYKGSEDKIGWSVPFEAAKTNNVYIITKEEQRESVEKYLLENTVKNIKFYFVDIPSFFKNIFKGFMYSGRLNIWNKYAFSLAKKLCKENDIDIIHQITPIEFRAIGNYGKIPNIKFVCGPLGGGETIPSCLKYYAKRHRVIEIIRMIANYYYRFNLKITKKLQNCDYIMFANEETEKFLNKEKNQDIFCSDKPITEIAIDTTDIKYLPKNKVNKKCIFLCAGRMIYRKGYDFLLDALMKVPKNLDYIFHIVGDGPELNRLQARCDSDKYLSTHVIFTGLIPYNKMESEYNNADVFVMPSIRETTGTVLLEAMSKGLPVITINKFGGSIILNNNTGWLYDGLDKESYIENLKDAIIDCILNPNEVILRGNNAQKSAKSYTWEEKNRHYLKIYYELLKN